MVLRYSAFTETPEGGNPAGVVLDARAWTTTEMQRIAKEVGYSESAFVTAREAEASTTCATSAPRPRCRSAGTRRSRPRVALAERDGAGPLVFHTQAGAVPIETTPDDRDADQRRPARRGPAGRRCSTARSTTSTGARRPRPRSSRRRSRFAGARHLILAANTRERLADLDYDFDALKH